MGLTVVSPGICLAWAILGCSILGKLRQTFPRMSTMAMYSFVQLVHMAIFFSLATF